MSRKPGFGHGYTSHTAMQLRFFEKDDSVCLERAQAATCTHRDSLEKRFAPLMREEPQLGEMVSYSGNKKVPLLRLYRYKEAFAFRFVEQFINRFGLTEEDCIFDPFCGMGTTLFVAASRGIPAVGIDRLPIAVFVAQTLFLFHQVQEGQLRATFEHLRSRVPAASPAPVAMDVAIMKIAFPPETLLALRKWKTVIDELDNPLRDVFRLLFFSILESCSYTSKDGQFLRLLRHKRVANPEAMLERRVLEAERDIKLVRELQWWRRLRMPAVYLADTRNLSDVPLDRPPTAIITSPPYVNRYDYTRSYSLELCFHFVKNFDELKALRLGILRSHIESRVSSDEKPPHPAVQEVVETLQAKRKVLNNPRIPAMLTGYFVDMEHVIREWARVLAPGARVAMVVDNVRFEGELLPVDLVLSEMAEAAGFQVEQIVVARYKGNSSQQMGKYGRVPVRESVVIWRKP